MKNNIVPGSFQLMKKINTGLILETIRLREPISRVEIAKYLNLTPATVTNLTKELIERGIIVEGELGKSSGGRKPIFLRINTDMYFIIAIHMEYLKIKISILNMKSEVIDSFSYFYEEGEKFYNVESIVKSSVWKILKDNCININSILGIGVAVNGLVNFEEGIIESLYKCDWKNIRLREILQSEFHVPVFADKDVRTMGLSEAWYGAGRDKETFLVIKADYGVSLSIISSKQSIRGANDSFGELGNVIVDTAESVYYKQSYKLNDFVCVIEKVKKEIENKSNNQNEILDKTIEIWGENITVGDALGISAQHIGTIVANLINVFNPSLIIIGGESFESFEGHFDDILSFTRKSYTNRILQTELIKLSTLGQDAIIKGAGILVLDNLFDSLG